MLIVGLTGGIASGKSTVARALQTEPGIVAINADRIAWETYQPSTEVYEKLVDHFGLRILNSDRTINRRALSKLIFQSDAERNFVNRIVHPAVITRLTEMASTYEAQGVDILIVEAALLLDSDSVDRSFFDCYVIVKVDPEEQIRRLIKRDGISREEALKKISSQTSQDERLRRADYVIDSSDSPEQTIQRAKALLAKLHEQAKRPKN